MTLSLQVVDVRLKSTNPLLGGATELATELSFGEGRCGGTKP